MSDLDQIRAKLMSAIDAAGSLDAIEAVRITALGKASEIAALMKTLGPMTPEQRQREAPAIQALREAVSAAIAARKAALDRAALDARLAAETLDMSLRCGLARRGRSTRSAR